MQVECDEAAAVPPPAGYVAANELDYGFEIRDKGEPLRLLAGCLPDANAVGVKSLKRAGSNSGTVYLVEVCSVQRCVDCGAFLELSRSCRDYFHDVLALEAA